MSMVSLEWQRQAQDIQLPTGLRITAQNVMKGLCFLIVIIIMVKSMHAPWLTTRMLYAHT